MSQFRTPAVNNGYSVLDDGGVGYSSSGLVSSLPLNNSNRLPLRETVDNQDKRESRSYRERKCLETKRHNALFKAALMKLNASLNRLEGRVLLRTKISSVICAAEHLDKIEISQPAWQPPDSR